MDLATKKTWIVLGQLIGTAVGGGVVVYLRWRGIRFLDFVPTLVFVWLPIMIGSALLLVVGKGPRNGWIVWGVSLLIFVGMSVYLGVGETPSALLPSPAH